MAASTSQGQRRRRVEGGRPARVVVRFTHEEMAAVAARAVAAGLTVPSYLALAGLRPDGLEAADAKSALTNLVGTRRVLAGVAETRRRPMTMRTNRHSLLRPPSGRRRNAIVGPFERFGRGSFAVADGQIPILVVVAKAGHQDQQRPPVGRPGRIQHRMHVKEHSPVPLPRG